MKVTDVRNCGKHHLDEIGGRAMSELDLDAIEREARARGYGSAGISPTFERIIALVARVRELEAAVASLKGAVNDC